MLGEDYGSGLATYFVNAFEDLGGTVTSEQFPEGTSDFSAYIQNAINAGADVIFAPCATTYAAQIITQAASAGFDKPITAGDTWESSVILDAQKGTSVQVYCSTFFDENDDSGAAKEFVTGFKEWLNADSQKLTNNGGNDIVAAVSALGYDGYMVALEAIKAAGSTDGTAIRDALYGVNFTKRPKMSSTSSRYKVINPLAGSPMINSSSLISYKTTKCPSPASIIYKIQGHFTSFSTSSKCAS